MKAIFFGNQNGEIFGSKKDSFCRVYSRETIDRLKSRLTLTEEIIEESRLEKLKTYIQDVDYIFSTWGMPCCSEDTIHEYFPSLKALFYGAGSVQSFARSFINCGVRIFSAWGANAVPVAEYTVAQIILANKGFYQASRISCKEDYSPAHKFSCACPGNYGAKVGLIGVGMIGSMVAEMLKRYRLDVMVYDPFLSGRRAAALGVTKCSLAQLFAECQTISCHLPDIQKTKGMLGYKLFSKMKKNAAFINTGRGAQVIEPDLAKAMAEEPSRTAILDVTFPEPPEPGHPFYSLDNVILTPHIAGSMNNELARMGEYMYGEFTALTENKPLKYEVTLEMLETMA